MYKESFLFILVTLLLFSFNTSLADDVVSENDSIENIEDDKANESGSDSNTDNSANTDNEDNDNKNDNEGDKNNNDSNNNESTDDENDSKTDGQIAGGVDPDAPTRLVKTISMQNFGGYVIRYGNFNRDDKVDILAVQNNFRTITCLTAFTFDGEILWQVGTPDENNYNIFSDRPVQVFDWNGDGIDDVIVVMNKRLKIINGENGKTIKSRKVVENDAVYVGSFWDGKKKILIKDRYSKFRVFNQKLRQIFFDRNNTGHFPMAFDFNRDGIDELIIGYSLYKNGKEGIVKKWDLTGKLKLHNDATDIADMKGNGTYQIGIADSSGGALVTPEGKILWQKKLKHSQHAVMGHFDPAFPKEQQIVFLDRGAAGVLYCYNRKGKLLWKSEPHGRVAVLAAVDGWSGNKNESFLLVSRRQMANPVLLNGKGKIVAEFPIDPSSLYDKNEPPKNRMKNFAQHFDMYGDGREEILINDHSKIYVYTNNEVRTNSKVSTFEGLPNARIYNATFYTGMQ